ncbi:hypothetical protein LEP1GSC050_4150 [Leptospira broomii serovar Hurstbridge str. 5399]|uniref:Uncharacterized protein n=1 Tax=Leptospira broomii serovar Hurstbridge str. 5399 TaxID=1049789 RepID=T0GBX3_9LEPT|nr:hypothetical protein LEP1GSC050_4150 [Leptospira broomii serovar Hurstbridge str. 5399]
MRIQLLIFSALLSILFSNCITFYKSNYQFLPAYDKPPLKIQISPTRAGRWNGGFGQTDPSYQIDNDSKEFYNYFEKNKGAKFGIELDRSYPHEPSNFLLGVFTACLVIPCYFENSSSVTVHYFLNDNQQNKSNVYSGTLKKVVWLPILI